MKTIILAILFISTLVYAKEFNSLTYTDGNEGVSGECLVSSDTAGTVIWDACGGGATVFDDATFEIQDQGGDSLGITFDVSASTGASKVITTPNVNVDLTDVGTNNTHRTGDGSDHADVATNTIHSGGNGADHSDVALNTTHRSSSGTDHANVVTNNAKPSGTGVDGRVTRWSGANSVESSPLSMADTSGSLQNETIGQGFSIGTILNAAADANDTGAVTISTGSITNAGASGNVPNLVLAPGTNAGSGTDGSLDINTLDVDIRGAEDWTLSNVWDWHLAGGTSTIRPDADVISLGDTSSRFEALHVDDGGVSFHDGSGTVQGFINANNTGSANFDISVPTASGGVTGKSMEFITQNCTDAVDCGSVFFNLGDNSNAGAFDGGGMTVNLGASTNGAPGSFLVTGGPSLATSGVRPSLVNADPCGDTDAYPEGSMFYNDTSNYFCFCDGTNDVQMHDPATACF